MSRAVKSPRREAGGGSGEGPALRPRPGARLVFFDGLCVSCNRWVRFLLRRDRRETMLAAPLQGALAAEVLARHGLDPASLETLAVVEEFGTGRERVRTRSDGVVACLRALGGIWRAPAALLSWLPRSFRDRVYDRLASSRHRRGGKLDACPRVEAELAGRILMDDTGAG